MSIWNGDSLATCTLSRLTLGDMDNKDRDTDQCSIDNCGLLYVHALSRSTLLN